MNKKAMEVNQWAVVGGALLLLIILAVLIYIFNGQIFGASSTLNTVDLQKSREMCQSEMDKLYQPTDADVNGAGDGFPDNIQRLGFWCDLCYGGDDNLDDDGDGVPNACDKNPNAPFDPKKSSFEKECKVWNANLKRCFPTEAAQTDYLSKFPQT